MSAAAFFFRGPKEKHALRRPINFDQAVPCSLQQETRAMHECQATNQNQPKGVLPKREMYITMLGKAQLLTSVFKQTEQNITFYFVVIPMTCFQYGAFWRASMVQKLDERLDGVELRFLAQHVQFVRCE